jgi:hypothetical protein
MQSHFDNPLSLLRQLKGAPISVLLACYWAGQPVSHKWLVQQTGYSSYAVTQALGYLTECQFLTHVTGGWMITDGAKQLPLMAALPSGEEQESDGQRIEENANLVGRFEATSIPETRFEDSSNLVLENRGILESCLKLEEEANSLINLTTVSSSCTENRGILESAGPEEKLPSVAKILAETSDLFGRPGVVASQLPIDKLSPTHVFAWLACAYDQWVDGGRKGRIQSPGAYVYKKLASAPFEMPALEYQHAWINILPEDWLERFGLIDYTCECGEVRKLRAEYERHLATHEDRSESRVEGEPAKSIVTKNNSVDPKALKVWESVVDQLRMHLPRASFDTWVQDAEPVNFDGSVLSIGARNAYARDWLQNRLSDLVNKLLTEIMSGVSVSFVVYAEET